MMLFMFRPLVTYWLQLPQNLLGHGYTILEFTVEQQRHKEQSL